MTFHGFPWPPVYMHPAAAKQNAHMVRRFAGMLAERVGRAPAVVKRQKKQGLVKKKSLLLHRPSHCTQPQAHSNRLLTLDEARLPIVGRSTGVIVITRHLRRVSTTAFAKRILHEAWALR